MVETALAYEVRASLAVFRQGLRDREWRLSYHELVVVGLREPVVEGTESPTGEVHLSERGEKEATVSVHAAIKEAGAKRGLLRWATDDRTEKTAKGLGWATASEAHKQYIIELIKGA